MKWLLIFDALRHIPEVFFFLIAGPLAAIVAYKKARESRDPQVKIMKLQKELLEMAHFNPELFKENVIPMLGELELRSKNIQYIEGGQKTEQ